MVRLLAPTRDGWTAKWTAAVILFISIGGCHNQARPRPTDAQAHSAGIQRAVADSLTWQPNGGALAFVRIDCVNGTPTRRRVEVVDAKSQVRIMLSDGPFDVLPTWTPDGRSLVYSQARGHDVRLQEHPVGASLAGHSLTRNGQYWISGGDGCWLDRSQLLCFGGPIPGRRHIYRWARTSGALKDMVLGESAIYPVASEDGHWIAYIDLSAGQRRLRIASLIGQTNFSAPAVGAYDVRWSHDSKAFLYLTMSRAGCEMHCFSVVARRDTVLARASTFCSPLSISRCNRVAVGCTRPHGTDYIVVVDATTGKTIAHSPANQECAAPCWSPDGERLAYIRRMGTDFRVQVAKAAALCAGHWER